MDTVGDLVSDCDAVLVGVGVRGTPGVEVGTGVDEVEVLIVNAFKQTFVFVYTELRSVHNIPLLLT
jgi:hypothetical protein